MPTVHYGKRNEPGFTLDESPDLIVVRTRTGRSIARSAGPVLTAMAAELDDGTLVAAYPEAGVEVFRVPVGEGARSLGERKSALKAASDVRFAGGVLVDQASQEPVIYTENLFVKFEDTVDPEDCVTLLRDAGLTIKYEVEYAENAYFAAAPEGTGQKVFEIANNLLQKTEVEYCHPELIRPRARKAIFPQQWHLRQTVVSGRPINAHANVEAAHAITRGEGVTIAVIDDGVDIDHPEFSSPGKVVFPRDVTVGSGDPRPKSSDDNHGTACAGVACGSGVRGASGVAPAARLMPIRLASGLGSQREADAFKWAADHGADILTCSWGPPDGRWWQPGDPRHNQPFPLPASTRLAIDYAVSSGRGGKGCVVLFAAGNGNESVDLDGYASYDKVIAVAACNDRGARSVYSDHGEAVWCAFPSSDQGYPPFNHPAPLTSGIWTTDRVGAAGYNDGDPFAGDADGLFANDFGGTSSSCPGAAGVAALVLSIDPGLKWNQVKDLLKQACDRIDQQGGNYGQDNHSTRYGYGRLNALTAVQLATPKPQGSALVSRVFNGPIPDLQTVTFDLVVPEQTPITALTVALDIQHTYIGDLIISLVPPNGVGPGPVILHNRAGGATKNLKKAYEANTTPALAAFSGKSCDGTWSLRIQDAAAVDAGTLVSFGLGLTF